MFCFVLSLCATASDREANEFFQQGREYEKTGKFRSAAERYMDARFMADSVVLKGNSLIAAARSYRKAELYGDEFDCLQKLIREHIGGIDFTQVVERQYKIGDAFFAGHRDLVVSWIPFLKKEDRTLEIYEAVLKNAPCAKGAAEVRLRLSRMYIDEQKPEDAVRHLREIPKLHPDTEIAKYAMLELCSLLLQMSKRGDGDGAYSRQALEACDDYLKNYPDSEQTPWVKKARQTIRNRIAARIHNVGKFYYDQGKPEIAEKYLADVVKNYSATDQAVKSEDLLAKIDKDFEIPEGPRRRYIPYKVEIKKVPIPKEDKPILVTPEESNNRWLLPVRDLRKSPVADPAKVSDFKLKERKPEKETEK